MRAEIENAFFYKNEQKLILDFKELGKGRYFISFYSYLVSVKNGVRYKFIKLNYVPNISKYEFAFEVFNTRGVRDDYSA